MCPQPFVWPRCRWSCGSSPAAGAVTPGGSCGVTPTSGTARSAGLGCSTLLGRAECCFSSEAHVIRAAVAGAAAQPSLPGFRLSQGRMRLRVRFAVIRVEDGALVLLGGSESCASLQLMARFPSCPAVLTPRWERCLLGTVAQGWSLWRLGEVFPFEVVLKEPCSSPPRNKAEQQCSCWPTSGWAVPFLQAAACPHTREQSVPRGWDVSPGHRTHPTAACRGLVRLAEPRALGMAGLRASCQHGRLCCAPRCRPDAAAGLPCRVLSFMR